MAKKGPHKQTRWIHISDVQFGHHPSDGEDHYTLVADMIATIRREQPDFVIHSGDHVAGAGEDDTPRRIGKLWREYHRAMDPLTEQCPVYSCPGNHDQTRPGRSLEEYCKHVGRAGKSPYYTATFGPIHLIMLDEVLRPGDHYWGDTVTTRLLHSGGFLSGSAQDRWLRRHLAKGRRGKVLVTIGHWPIFMSRNLYFDTDSSLRYDEITKHPGNLLPQLIKANCDLYLCGHHHVYERSRHPKLMQVKTGADGIAWPHLMEDPNKYSVIQDYRHGYTRFTYDPSAHRIHGEAVDLDGDVIDAWSQKAKE